MTTRGHTAPSVIGSPGVVDRLLDFAFPTDCLGCTAPLPWRAAQLGLCSPCRERLGDLRALGCQLCGSTAASGCDLCPGCGRLPRAFDRIVAAWSYSPPVDSILRALKFHGRLSLAADIGHALAALFPRLASEHDAVTAVPLHPSRRRRRGFDQSREIAAALAKDLGLPCRTLLRRTRRTPPQSRLGRDARLANIRGAFAPIRRRRWHGGIEELPFRVLVVDDIATTGATLNDACRALRVSPLIRITALVAARPERRPKSLPTYGPATI